MSIKTCVVLGTFQIGDNHGQIIESAVFGLDSDYATAHDFIQSVLNLHRHASDKFSIYSVVIG